MQGISCLTILTDHATKLKHQPQVLGLALDRRVRPFEAFHEHVTQALPYR